ncbi:MAG: nicotinate (nicotinamide) nucleotide adenylyltransferase [Flavobacteriales bacterium]
MKIGLFFGSFNPIHIGHMTIAQYIVEHTSLDKIWLVVSPQNPFKEKSSLLAQNHRLSMVQLATDNDVKLEASNIEFSLPTPSYTIDTLTYTKEKYPQHDFSIIMGADNLLHFHKWKNYKQILNHHEIFVYPRPKTQDSDFSKLDNVHLVDAPIIEISSQFIRKSIKTKKDIRYFLPKNVWEYIDEMNFYKS